MVNIVRNPQFEDDLNEWEHSPGVEVFGSVSDTTVTGNSVDIPGGCFVRQEYDPPPVLGGTHRLLMRMNPLKSGRLLVQVRFSYSDGTHTDIRYPGDLPSTVDPEKPDWNFLILEAEEGQHLSSIRINNMNTHEHATVGIADLVLDIPE